MAHLNELAQLQADVCGKDLRGHSDCFPPVNGNAQLQRLGCALPPGALQHAATVQHAATQDKFEQLLVIDELLHLFSKHGMPGTGYSTMQRRIQ